jgi:hypothetical protein
MNLIHNNPFRILGVTANASLSDRKQQANLIAQYLKIGQNAKLDFDITPPLSPIERSKELIELQSSRIHSTEDKILHSLFWFVQANGVDKIALKHLTKSKDIDKALNDFEKGCRGFVVSDSSYSSILNHSTLQIIAYRRHKNLNKLKEAISNKFNIVSDSHTLILLKNLVAADGMNTTVDRILELAIPKLKELLSELVPEENTDKLLLDIFKSNKIIYAGLENEVINLLVKKITLLIGKTESDREKLLKQNFSSSILKDIPLLGKRLIEDSTEHLENIESLLSKSDSSYTDVLQNLFEEVNFCGVLPFNKLIEKINDTQSRTSVMRLKKDAELSHIVSLYKLAIQNLEGFTIPIKDTLIKNLKGISEFELEENCKFCNINDVSELKQVKVPMYKFTNVMRTQYTYFKDGGFAVSSCSSCYNKITSKKVFSFLLAFAVYAGLAGVTSGISVLIDGLLTRFMLYTWWSSWVKKKMYYSEVEKHPVIRQFIMEGYEYGEPK